jgi:hypothetical protein
LRLNGEEDTCLIGLVIGLEFLGENGSVEDDIPADQVVDDGGGIADVQIMREASIN